MSLDKKLRDLKIDPYILKDATKLSGKDIEAIKQAFIDEGWRHPSSDQFLEMAEHFGYLKGPEWLARLKKECEKVGDKKITADEVIKAAKRAAGVSHDPEEEQRKHDEWRRSRR